MSSPRDLAGPVTGELLERGAEIMETHWRPQGFTCPNSGTYPWLWLWDSCFHSIIWAHLGNDERAVVELETALSSQDADGFIPHLAYLDGYDGHAGFWGRDGTSSITQPPIYGHAVAELTRMGIDVPERLLTQAADGIRFLLDRRRRSSSGLVELVHPWESGCDHSPRWDDLMRLDGTQADHDPYDGEIWFNRKGELLESIVRSPAGAPLSNPDFAVGSVAFNAIVAFCAQELALVTGDDELDRQSRELGSILRGHWNADLRTWTDDGPTAAGSGRIRTLESLLPLLVEKDQAIVADVLAQLIDTDAFGGQFGLWQVHPDEPRFRRGSYWRGPTWPQLDYLMWLAITRVGRADLAAGVAGRTRRGMDTSGFAEYWDADTARPGGAVPQSWAVLGTCMAGSPANGAS
ncbi:MAG: hypothetical protein WBA45_04305 [Microthrixaceae bacterium]